MIKQCVNHILNHIFWYHVLRMRIPCNLRRLRHGIITKVHPISRIDRKQ